MKIDKNRIKRKGILGIIAESLSVPIQYRQLIWILAMKELKIRYRGSVLGFLWSTLNTLILLSIYTFVFTVVFKTPNKNYPLYIFVGLLPWTWFSSSVGEATMAVVTSGAFINKSTLPSEIVVLVKVVANFVNYLLSLIVLFISMFVFGAKLGWPLAIFPLIVVVEFLITSGISFLVATWEVYYRDTQHIVMNILQILFWSVPIVYMVSQLPEKIQKLVFLNPLAYMIKVYADIFYYNRFPQTFNIVLLILVSLFVYVLGFYYFNTHKEEFPELV